MVFRLQFLQLCNKLFQKTQRNFQDLVWLVPIIDEIDNLVELDTEKPDVSNGNRIEANNDNTTFKASNHKKENLRWFGAYGVIMLCRGIQTTILASIDETHYRGDYCWILFRRIFFQQIL